MARRMEIELTSKRDDGTWTWRAAGAREPKGTLDGAIVPPATQVGDVVRVEVEGFLDGITVVSVLPAKTPRTEPERIDLLTPRSEGPMVTTRLARTPRRDRPRSDERGDRGERGDRDHRGRRRSDRNDRSERGPRSERDRDRDRGERGDRGDRGDRRERTTPAPPPVDAKPKPKRLRPAKVHRTALLEALPAEQRPIAEQLLQGGIPAVRQAIEKQNEELKADGKSQVAAEPLIEIAEKLRHRAQAAAWRDRADAALSQVDELDLRDLRSVVNAADDGGRDEEARNVAAQLREALIQRVEKEQAAWVDEVAENLRDGRVVRALRLSSRPPKAGSPLPPDLSAQLIADTGAALTADTGPQRWATILDALAFSPIRRRVVPASLPDKLNAEMRGTIARLGTRLPEIAHIFDITPDEAPSRPPRQGSQARRGKGAGGARGEQPEGKSKPRKRRGDKPPTDRSAKPDAGGKAAKTEQPSAGTDVSDDVDKPSTGVGELPGGTDAEVEQAVHGDQPKAETPTDTDVATELTPAPAKSPPDTEAPAADEATAANAAGTDATTPAPTESSEVLTDPSPEAADDGPAADAAEAEVAPADESASTETAPDAAATLEATSDDATPAEAEVAPEAPADEPPAAMVDDSPADEAGGEPDAMVEEAASEPADAGEMSNGTEANSETTADDGSVRVDS